MQAVMEITFREFQAGDAEAFRALNEQWIAKYFVLEAKDIETLSEPEKHILKPGGHIYFATLDDEIVGCCALIVNGQHSYEVAKMAVSEEHRNKGIGKALLTHVIEETEGLDAYKLTLETNSKLSNAIHVYESVGFRHLDPSEVEPSPYKRANVYMEMFL
ncbi:MAG TPA: GNAT family N-acetyltransferase [Pseudacidobacterium sp.]|jgi:GNAT superfamily N-acetyltransferase|nr:GNAT family N-acetyltransferase [Pseudacidobacterium sp.]